MVIRLTTNKNTISRLVPTLQWASKLRLSPGQRQILPTTDLLLSSLGKWASIPMCFSHQPCARLALQRLSVSITLSIQFWSHLFTLGEAVKPRREEKSMHSVHWRQPLSPHRDSRYPRHHVIQYCNCKFYIKRVKSQMPEPQSGHKCNLFCNSWLISHWQQTLMHSRDTEPLTGLEVGTGLLFLSHLPLIIQNIHFWQ